MQVTIEVAAAARRNGAGTGAATTNLVLPAAAAGVPPGWRRPVHGQQKPVARTPPLVITITRRVSGVNPLCLKCCSSVRIIRILTNQQLHGHRRRTFLENTLPQVRLL